MVEALARLVERASRSSQIWLTTHSTRFADALVARGATRVVLEKVRGETRVEGLGALG